MRFLRFIIVSDMFERVGPSQKKYSTLIPEQNHEGISNSVKMTQDDESPDLRVFCLDGSHYGDHDIIRANCELFFSANEVETECFFSIP
jgi:hypothetical protein